MILVTGGTGYIGSHTVVQLLQSGHEVLILDNLCNSKPAVLERIAAIAGGRPDFIHGDIRDRALLQDLFSRYSIQSVIHFAGLKAVGESVANPVLYYHNNVAGSLVLFEEMARAHVTSLVFSSSATVYGNPHFLPYTESHPLSATNPYGQSKLMVEQILRDISAADHTWSVALLRYFNPVGAHPSGLIGEDPSGIPNNLMPFISQVAVGKRDCLSIFGNDYDTKDGTGVRDYIHVEDLAVGHLAALEFIQKQSGVVTVNLGTGKGTSVLELVQAFETASSQRIPYQFVARRPGDTAANWADTTLAAELLHWKAKYDIVKMCEDTWRWQSQNPEGYPD